MGAWGGELPTVLVVEEIDPDGTARVAYSWGSSPENTFKPGWTRLHGSIGGGTLRLTNPGGPALDFSLEKDGRLLGRYSRGGVPAYVELERISGRDPAVIAAVAARPRCGARCAFRKSPWSARPPARA
jgi:hypothetical protein